MPRLETRLTDMAELLAVHPITVWHPVQLGIFQSYQTCWRWMNRDRAKGKPRYVGGVKLAATGRKTDVYCNGWTPKNLKHEVLLTDELIPLWQMTQDMLRGPKVDPDMRPDATVLFEEKELHYEMDTGTERHEQLKGRMRIVGQYIDPVVWVVLDEKRLAEVLKIASDNSYVKLHGSDELFNSRGEKQPYTVFLQSFFNGLEVPC